MAVSSQPDNGKVTLALIGLKQDQTTAEIKALREDFKQWAADCDHRVKAVESWCTTSQERWRQHEKDHEDISRKNTIGDWVAYIGAALAAVIGAKVN